MLKLALAAVLVVIAIPAAWIALPTLTEQRAIPDSCRQPADVVYADAGAADPSPYVVRFSSRRHLPWRTSSDAIIGRDLDEDASVASGTALGVESADVDGFSCRWTSEGVTIVEPATGSAEDGTLVEGIQIEHHVPAKRFVGGR